MDVIPGVCSRSQHTHTPHLTNSVSFFFHSELLPNLPSDGIFSFDSLLSKGHRPEQAYWQWKDDQNVWHSYSWIDSRIIEAAHQGGEDELSLNTLGRSYIVDFNSMQQVQIFYYFSLLGAGV